MNFIWNYLGRVALPAILSWALLCQPSQAEDRMVVPRMVFAHYMVCCPRDGLAASVEDFSREIRAAQSYGIDGFALNMPGWLHEPHYREISHRIFQAAELSSPPFKLFVSFDDAPVADSAAMLRELSQSKNYLRIDGRPVVSTYGGTPAWGMSLIAQLSVSGLKPFLVPNYQKLSTSFWSKVYARPTESFLDRLYQDNPEIDGYFTFGPDLGFPKLPTDIGLLAKVSKTAGKLSMAGISPYYRGLRGNFRVFESGGFEGMAAQWTAAITAGADWVELVTWNDWGESTYLAPYGDIREQDLWNYNWGPLLSHEAYLKASRYFIDWFKSSRQPVIERSAIYYFYRLHSKSAYGIQSPDSGEQGRPQGSSSLVDGIYISSFLPHPLTATLTFDSRKQSITLPAGVSHHRFDMFEGNMTISVQDENRVLTSKQLEFPVTKLGQIGNFNYFAGELRLP